MSAYTDLIERLRRPWFTNGCEQYQREAADAIAKLEAERDALLGVLKVADDAIAEMFRYYDGGEARGSYDGKPERNQLRKAGYATRAAIAKTTHTPAGN